MPTSWNPSSGRIRNSITAYADWGPYRHVSQREKLGPLAAWEPQATSVLESPLRYAGEPTARRCWKHSRQKTGRPCVGRNGTVVSFPHCEQVVLVSDR